RDLTSSRASRVVKRLKRTEGQQLSCSLRAGTKSAFTVCGTTESWSQASAGLSTGCSRTWLTFTGPGSPDAKSLWARRAAAGRAPCPAAPPRQALLRVRRRHSPLRRAGKQPPQPAPGGEGHHGENRAATQSHAGEHHQPPARGRGLPVVPEEILSSTIKPYNAEDNENFKTIVEFECRGLEPVDFQPQAGFAAEGVESGTVFSDIDLQEKDWTDYDEKAQESVGIYEVTHQFVKC
uniref:CXXC motif containing zinc binding protein n=1 Tax=Macaca fascicularis TaxID=9541 RepID=A0A7N9CJE7_MACFA